LGLFFRCSLFQLLLLIRQQTKPLDQVQAILRRVTVKVIIEVTNNLLYLARSFFHLRNPRLQLRLAVSIIKPWILSSPMPPKISKIRRQTHFRRQQRLINNSVSHIKLFQKIPSFISHPRQTTKLDSVLKHGIKQLKERFQPLKVKGIFRRKLNQQTSKFNLLKVRLVVMPHLWFDKGTLLLNGAIATPYGKWDPRSGYYRLKASHYKDATDHLKESRIQFEDNVPNLPPLNN